MDRLHIINHLITKNGYTDYCEIGVFTGYTLDGCIASNKIGIDPQCGHYKGDNNIFCGTSDEFFKKLPMDKKFQIFFIDGLHESSQVDRDIENSLKHLSPGGTIVMHDCSPSSYEMTTTGTQHGEWTGDVYKSFINFTTGGRCDYYVVDNDYGVGVIRNYIGLPQSAKLDYEWAEFDAYRKKLLNLISVEKFLAREPINQVAC